MSSFGFDPSIILSANAGPQPSINDTLETLAHLAGQRTQQQHAQAQLADMARQQQRQQELEGIYRGNADTQADLPTALMHAGFGPQAYAAQDQASQMQSQEATRGKLIRDVQDAHRKKVGELFYGTKDATDYQARVQQLASDPDPMLAVYASHLPAQFDPAVTERLGNLAMTAKERADLVDKAKTLEQGDKRLGIEGRRADAADRRASAVEARLAAGGGTGPGSSVASTRRDALAARLSENMTHALDEGQWKGPIAAQVTSKNQAEHLLALTEGAKGGFNNLDSREQEELAIGFAKLLSGGQGSEATVKSLVPPRTLQSGAQGLKEWLLNEPQGRNQLVFVERLAHSVERQRGVAEKLIEAEKAKRAGSYRKLLEMDPEQHQAVLIGAGLDPSAFDEKGVYRARPAAKESGAEAPSGGLSADQADELKRLEAKYGGGKK